MSRNMSQTTQTLLTSLQKSNKSCACKYRSSLGLSTFTLAQYGYVDSLPYNICKESDDDNNNGRKLVIESKFENTRYKSLPFDSQGYTSLHYSLQHNNVNTTAKIISYLMHYNPDSLYSFSKNTRDLTPLQLALTITPESSPTLLHRPAFSGSFESLSLLLQALKGLPLSSLFDYVEREDRSTKRGQNCLHKCCEEGRVKALVLILFWVVEQCDRDWETWGERVDGWVRGKDINGKCGYDIAAAKNKNKEEGAEGGWVESVWNNSSNSRPDYKGCMGWLFEVMGLRNRWSEEAFGKLKGELVEFLSVNSSSGGVIVDDSCEDAECDDCGVGGISSSWAKGFGMYFPAAKKEKFKEEIITVALPPPKESKSDARIEVVPPPSDKDTRTEAATEAIGETSKKSGLGFNCKLCGVKSLAIKRFEGVFVCFECFATIEEREREGESE